MAFSNLLKESLPSCWFPHPLMATPAGRGTQPSTPASQPVCSRRGSQGGQEGMCRPHLPRVGASAASALRCPSQFSRSLQHPVLGPPAVLGAPCHPASPSASLHTSVSTCAMTVGLRVFLLSPGAWPGLSAAPTSLQLLAGAWRLAGGRVCSQDRRMRGGCPVPVAGSPRPQCLCSGFLLRPRGGSSPGPLQPLSLAGVGGAWTRGSIAISEPSPWRLPVSVSPVVGFTGHQSYWTGARPLQGSLSFTGSSHRRPVSKQATRPGAGGSVLKTSLGEQAQPQGED